MTYGPTRPGIWESALAFRERFSASLHARRGLTVPPRPEAVAHARASSGRGRAASSLRQAKLARPRLR